MTIDVVSAVGLVTVQDLGRPGRMHEALAPGGALVPELLVRANRTAHNADGTPAIEVCGRLVVRAVTEVLVATDRPYALAAGDELAIQGDARRVVYLAIRGGVDARELLGGCGAHLSAGLGDLLRAGDRVTPAGAAPHELPVAPFHDRDLVEVIAGPDLDAFDPEVRARFVGSTYRISPSSDRVGTRLEGPPLRRAPGHVDTSRPMVRGAIEVPPDGTPIVLGPEHPTTGGYPVLAVISHADLGRFFAIRLGGRVRFREG